MLRENILNTWYCMTKLNLTKRYRRTAWINENMSYFYRKDWISEDAKSFQINSWVKKNPNQQPRVYFLCFFFWFGHCLLFWWWVERRRVLRKIILEFIWKNNQVKFTKKDMSLAQWGKDKKQNSYGWTEWCR